MNNNKTAGYGSWKSPVTSDLVSSSSIGLNGQIEIIGETIYWLEMRPSEGGRYVLVRRTPDGKTTDVTPAPYNVRTRVHEYGGGSYMVDGDTVYFSNFADQRLYKQESGAAPIPLTPENNMRYADGVIDTKQNRIICVCEDHSVDDKEPENCIASVDVNSGEVQKLVTGNDFYSSPRVSPDGSQLVWLSWDHPNMPWDFTELRVADIGEDGELSMPVKLAGGRDEAVSQPEYSPDGVLYFVWEKTGWLNLYRWKNEQAEPLCEMDAEFSTPHWVFAQSNYSFESENKIICSYQEKGRSVLAALDTKTLELKQIRIPYTSISAVKACSDYTLLLAGSPTEPSVIVKLDVESGKTVVLQRSTDIKIDAGYISVPESIEFPTENGLTSHAIYYKPKNTGYSAPEGERPPLMVIIHGGPTSASSSTFSLSIQYWTSRGFAVADVNYGGSTGYGREYRQRLDGNWGIVDIDDCVNCAKYLIDRGEVDRDRTAIRGGSAGGYTTLAALAFRDVFRAGASYYGVSDLEALATDTHKFESRYLDRIVGSYPEQRDLYTKRSPIHSVDTLSCPVIFFQGDEDKIVLSVNRTQHI